MFRRALKHSLLSIQDYRLFKLQGPVSRTTLQIDMQSFVSTKSDLLGTKNEKSFSPKIEICSFVILATMICLFRFYDNKTIIRFNQVTTNLCLASSSVSHLFSALSSFYFPLFSLLYILQIPVSLPISHFIPTLSFTQYSFL